MMRMTTAAGGHLNQVDLGAVGALVEKIGQRPSAAQTTWSAEVRWTGAFRSEAAVAELHAKVAATSPVGQTLSKAIPVEISPA